MTQWPARLRLRPSSCPADLVFSGRSNSPARFPVTGVQSGNLLGELVILFGPGVQHR